MRPLPGRELRGCRSESDGDEGTVQAVRGTNGDDSTCTRVSRWREAGDSEQTEALHRKKKHLEQQAH